MDVVSEDATRGGEAARLVDAAIRLLAERGPSAIKTLTVASATGLSTVVIYSHVGGIPELTRAVIDQGFRELDTASAQLPATDDPIADLAVQALACRRVARRNPHLYDLKFGLSTRGSYRPQQSATAGGSGRSLVCHAAYARVAQACVRLMTSGRVKQRDPEGVAAQLWSFVHGFITLELAETFIDFDDSSRRQSRRAVM